MATTMTMPVGNEISLASKYLPILDEIYQNESKTAILDTANERVRWSGAKTVNLFALTMGGLGNYSRNSGFVAGDVDGTWESYTISQDRGRSFSIDVMDNDETLGMALASTLSQFERTKVVPECDAYRFAKYYANAGKKVTGTLSSATDMKALLDEAQAYLDDKEVPTDGRILFLSPEAYKILKGDITRFTLNGEGGINYNVEMFDDMRVVRVPQARFNTEVTLSDPTTHGGAGGYSAIGSKINFMIVHPSAVLQVVKHLAPRMFSPEVNQEADAWKLNYRLYHDCWVENNKTDGIYVHTEALAPSLTISTNIGASTDLFGKTIGDLQYGVNIGVDNITGTLKYVSDYTAAGFDMSKGHNFIALKAVSDTGATITGEVIGGSTGAPTTLDSDGILVAQMADNTKPIRFVATKDGVSKTIVYSVLGMTFNEA